MSVLYDQERLVEGNWCYLEDDNYITYDGIYICVRFQIIKLKWHCLSSEIQCSSYR